MRGGQQEKEMFVTVFSEVVKNAITNLERQLGGGAPDIVS